MMASSSRIVPTLLLLLLSLLVLVISEAQPPVSLGAPAALPQKLDCGIACAERCSETKRPNLCKRACGSCCDRCSCVPPGTSGNLDACPCYANLTTRNNIRKCP